MSYITENQIDQAIELIINTRDFCGDEMLAIIDFCQDIISSAFYFLECKSTKAIGLGLYLRIFYKK
jgi:hypothetical protein